ncbi:hypothetical protein Z517_03007 [Fonsecaea pedrosoi CBS 271.37]|uniref:Unplaced genomic scaffold supercont1.2, whole genome shotgun sequence n=1 Tax=Fonsecaea pedrosoi CBS 271.37 TaxID=1442368 RepID=A0A0D2E102_9EURO|nr:uncharacterized protein Z517_03007 [Fonsecaea pedrosoi CBS 271.37]KIW83761.1 hypothetical protein Z517_03007 [Fonsecaea pedrosoi CBS 271.37]
MANATNVDALIVGAGFGGIYQLKRLRDLGMNAVVVDKASDVGGTWYWNRYPGAMSDTESYLYRFTWDKEDLQTYPWENTYLSQSEILAYLKHVVAKHNLRQHMKLSTEMLSADWDADHWRVTASTGEVFHARYLITALGLLSVAVYPDIPGLDTFKGQKCHTSAWDPSINLEGKRVGIIGCGSTGVQVITEIADKVGQLYCFQRHPQYSVPSGIKPVTPEYRDWVNKNYEKIIADQKTSLTCFGIPESTTPYSQVPPAEREAVFEKLWEEGNAFRFMFAGFSDIGSDKEANEAACAFIRKKIAQIVKDPEKARKLTPHDAYARRPVCDHGYYKQFNRDNVDIVHLQEEPIQSITPTGIMTTARHYDLDVLIFATGFDAIDGSYSRVLIRGANGQTLKEYWSDGPRAYLGLNVSGFPNMFMITGPQGPFTNVPPMIEQHVDINTKIIQHTEAMRLATGRAVAEVRQEAEDEWVEHCNALANATLFPQTPSWIFGNNVEGKPIASRYYMGGMVNYLKYVNTMIQNGYRDFKPIGQAA